MRLYLLTVQAWPWLPLSKGLAVSMTPLRASCLGRPPGRRCVRPLHKRASAHHLGSRDMILAVEIAHSPHVRQRSTLRRQRSSERRTPRMRWRTQKMSLLRRRKLAALLPSR